MGFTFIQFCIIDIGRMPQVSMPFTQILMLGIRTGLGHQCDNYEMSLRNLSTRSPEEELPFSVLIICTGVHK